MSTRIKDLLRSIMTVFIIFTFGSIFINSDLNAQSTGSLSGIITDGHGHGIPNAQVTLYYQGDPQWGGQRGAADTWTYTDSSGRYTFPQTLTPGPVDSNLNNYSLGWGRPVVTVTLCGPGISQGPGALVAAMAMKSARAYSQVFVSATTPPLQSTTGTLNIDLSNNQGIMWCILPSKDDLDDFAIMYLHLNQAVQFALNTLTLNLDHAPPVETYGDAPQSFGGTWYTSQLIQPPGWGTVSPSSISIDATDNGFTSGNRPDNREWHEFSHHIMADSLIGGNNTLPGLSSSQDGYHAGYFANSDSVAGWTEGFAEFMSCEIASQFPAYPPIPAATPIQGTLPPYPPQWYGGWGNPCWWDLEWQTDMRGPTRLNEEFAIAGILWDMEDPINPADNDFVDLTINQVWNVLNQNTAPGTGGNRDSLRDVYEAFSTFAAGNTALQTNIDRIFIAHGAFDDVNGNSVRDTGEAVGFSGDSARAGRRNVPYLENSLINITVIDAWTRQEVEVDGFLVQVVFDPPHEYLNADFVVSYFDQAKNSIYFSMAPFPQYNSTAYIIPIKAGYCDNTPLVITNFFYWDKIKTSDYIVKHTFRLTSGNCIPRECVNQNNYSPPQQWQPGDLGDLNEDGEITTQDAMIAFRCYVKAGPCPDNADVNMDGKITPLDALCLFKKCSGILSCLD